MTRRIPHRPLSVTDDDDGTTTAVGQSYNTTAIRPVASKVTSGSATCQRSYAVAETLQHSDIATSRGDNVEQRQTIATNQDHANDPTELHVREKCPQSSLLKSDVEIDKTILTSYCGLMSSSDYREEGSLPLGVMIDKLKRRGSDNSLRFVCRVCSISLRPKQGGHEFEFVIYCDRFFDEEAPFSEMPSVVRKRIVVPVAAVEELTVPWAQTTHSVPAANGELCTLPYITDREMLDRGWLQNADSMGFPHAIDTMKAKAAWEKDFLSNVRGEDIIKKVTGLNLYQIHEIVAKAKEC